jgi:hypothetical protein
MVPSLRHRSLVESKNGNHYTVQHWIEPQRTLPRPHRLAVNAPQINVRAKRIRQCRKLPCEPNRTSRSIAPQDAEAMFACKPFHGFKIGLIRTVYFLKVLIR